MTVLNYLFFTLFVAVTIATAALQQNHEPQNPEQSARGWYVPHANGSFYWLAEEQHSKLTKSLISEAAPIQLYLYTRLNPNDPQHIDSSKPESLKTTYFDPQSPTRIIIHGWESSYLGGACTTLRKAYLKQGDYNVICVDWSEDSGTILYPLASYRVDDVGIQLAVFIDFAHEQNGLSFETLEIDGHSLGAHCAGIAGKNVQKGRVRVIRGLDPALPFFSYDKPDKRLASTDAFYVESIQTSAGRLGFLEPIGKAAFYPNGGKYQPGCGTDLTARCAHARSYQYYAEAILNNGFPSVRCANYESALSDDCGKDFGAERLGADLNVYNASGVFYTPVNEKSPFGLSN